MAVTVAMPEEILADQDRRLFVDRFSRFDFLVKHDDRRAGRQGHLRLVELRLVLLRLEWQVQDS